MATSREFWGDYMMNRARTSMLKFLETSTSPAHNSSDPERIARSSGYFTCCHEVYCALEMTSLDAAQTLGGDALDELQSEGRVVFYTRDDGHRMVRLPS